MRRRNNNDNYNYNHILTRDERVFYQRIAIEGTQKIIAECWKVVNNPKEKDERKTMEALRIALDGNAAVLDMLSKLKGQYFPAAAAADHESDYDYYYGR
jgi:hypothetical protein